MLAPPAMSPTQEIMAAADKLKELGIKFKVVNVADLLSLQSAKENDEALTDEARVRRHLHRRQAGAVRVPLLRSDVRGLIYDRPNHDNFNVHGYEEEGSTTTPYDAGSCQPHRPLRAAALKALRMIDRRQVRRQDRRARGFRNEAFQFAVDNGYDHPDYTDWSFATGVNTQQEGGAVTATAAAAGDNE